MSGQRQKHIPAATPGGSALKAPGTPGTRTPAAISFADHSTIPMPKSPSQSNQNRSKDLDLEPREYFPPMVLASAPLTQSEMNLKNETQSEEEEEYEEEFDKGKSDKKFPSSAKLFTQSVGNVSQVSSNGERSNAYEYYCSNQLELSVS